MQPEEPVELRRLKVSSIVVASLAYSAVLHPPDDTISPSHTPVSITTAETNDTDDMFSKTETDFD